MKRLLLAILASLALGGTAFALSPHYKSVYCYPTGTYWAKQVAAYPDYYAAHNAYYTSHYGAGTKYCP